MSQSHHEIRPLATAQLFYEIAQPLDARRIHPSEFRRRLSSACADVGHAHDGYLHALPLERDRGGE
jgi:hypothetical protein